MHEHEGQSFNRGIAALVLFSAATVIAVWALGGATAGEGEVDQQQYAPTRYDVHSRSRSPSLAEELNSQVADNDPVLRALSMALSVPAYDLDHFACGRYLHQIAAGEVLPREDELDMQNARRLRRGRGWIMIEVPLSRQLLEKETSTAEVRFVEYDGDWKLEHIRMTKRLVGE